MGCDDSQALARAPGRDRPRGVEHALRGTRAFYGGAASVRAGRCDLEGGGSRHPIRHSFDLGSRIGGDGVEPRSQWDEDPGVRV